MRVGLVLDYFEPQRGGAEYYLSRLLKHLMQRGHEARVYCLDGKSEDPQLQLCKVSVRAVTRGRREREFAQRAVARARRDECLVFAVRHLLEADVYQPHGGTWRGASRARLRARSWPKWTSFWRNLSGKHRYFLEADRAIFENNPGMLTVAVSEMIRGEILEAYGSASPQVEVLWPAIDTQRFQPDLRGQHAREFRRQRGWERSSYVALFVAHDFALKGLGNLIKAFAISQQGRRGAHLVVVGRGRQRPYRSLAQQLGIADRVVFEPASDRMEDYYGAADLLVHPTYYDPCALVCLEALASAVPVLTTQSNGAAAWIEEGVGVVVEDPAQINSLADGIDRGFEIGEVPLDKAMQVTEQLSWDRQVMQMEAIFLRALAGKASS